MAGGATEGRTAVAQRRLGADGADGATDGPLARFAAVRGGATPEAAMDAAVTALLREHTDGGPPVALRPVWRSFGARVAEAAGAGPDGRLEVAHGNYRIVVREDQYWRRRRFTVAHEIGHMVLFEAVRGDPEAVRALTEDAHWAAVERLCDRAASRLLLPDASFLPDATRAPFGDDALRWLYDRYLVSWAVLLRRLAEGVGPSSVSRWSRHRRHEGEAYAPRVTAAYAWDGGPFLPRGMTCRHVTPDLVVRCYAGGTAVAPAVSVDLRGRPVVTGPGVALPWAPAAVVPEFRGMPVPEEAGRPWDVLLVVGPLAGPAARVPDGAVPDGAGR